MSEHVFKGSFDETKYSQPIIRGGTAAMDVIGAQRKLGYVRRSSLGVPGGVAKLNALRLLPFTTLPSGVVISSGVTVGLASEAVAGMVTTFKITNYDSFTDYTVTATVGTVQIVKDTISYSLPVGATTGGFTINGDYFPVTIISAKVAKPTIMAPIQGATNVTAAYTVLSGAFSVTAGTDTHAASTWQLATDPNFANIVQELVNTTVSKSSWSISGMGNSTMYYVRVRYTGTTFGTSEWSDVRSFTTVAAAPAPTPGPPPGPAPAVTIAAPVIQTPIEGFSLGFPITGPVTVTTSDFAVATGTDTFDKAVLSIMDGTATEVATLTTTSTLVSFNAASSYTFEDGKTYKFRVRHYGVTGAFADSNIVTVATSSIVVTPTKPAITFPANAAIDQSTDLTLAATAFTVSPAGTDTVSESEWQIATDAAFTTVVKSVVNTASPFSQWAVTGLETGVTYYARMRYKGVRTPYSPYSDAVSFKTKLPIYTPTVTAPLSIQYTDALDVVITNGKPKASVTVKTQLNEGAETTSTFNLSETDGGHTFNFTKADYGVGTWKLTFDFGQYGGIISKTVTIGKKSLTPVVKINGSTAGTQSVVDTMVISITDLPPTYDFSLFFTLVADGVLYLAKAVKTDTAGNYDISIPLDFATATGAWSVRFDFPPEHVAYTLTETTVTRTVNLLVPTIITDKNAYALSDTMNWNLVGGMPGTTVTLVTKVNGVVKLTNTYVLDIHGTNPGGSTTFPPDYQGLLVFEATFPNVPAPRNVVTKNITVGNATNFTPLVTINGSAADTVTSVDSFTVKVTGLPKNYAFNYTGKHLPVGEPVTIPLTSDAGGVYEKTTAYDHLTLGGTNELTFDFPNGLEINFPTPTVKRTLKATAPAVTFENATYSSGAEVKYYILGGIANSTVSVAITVGGVTKTTPVVLDANGVGAGTHLTKSTDVGVLSLTATYPEVPTPRNVVTQTANIIAGVTYTPVVLINNVATSPLLVTDSFSMSVSGLPANYSFDVTTKLVSTGETSVRSYTTNASQSFSTTIPFDHTVASGTWELTFVFPSSGNTVISVPSITRNLIATAPAIDTDKLSYASSDTMSWAIYGGMPNSTVTVAMKVGASTISTATHVLDANGLKTGMVLPLAANMIGTLTIEATYPGIAAPRNVVTKSVAVTQSTTTFTPVVAINGSADAQVTTVDSVTYDITGLPPDYTFTLSAKTLSTGQVINVDYVSGADGKFTKVNPYDYLTAGGIIELTFKFPNSTGVNFTSPEVVRTVTLTAPALTVEPATVNAGDLITYGVYGGVANSTATVEIKVMKGPSYTVLKTETVNLDANGVGLFSAMTTAAYVGAVTFSVTYAGVPAPRNVVSKTVTVNAAIVYTPTVTAPASVTFGQDVTLTVVDGKPGAALTVTNKLNGAQASQVTVSLTAGGGYTMVLKPTDYNAAGTWEMVFDFGAYGGVISKTVVIAPAVVNYNPTLTIAGATTNPVLVVDSTPIAITGLPTNYTFTYTTKVLSTGVTSAPVSVTTATGTYNNTITFTYAEIAGDNELTFTFPATSTATFTSGSITRTVKASAPAVVLDKTTYSNTDVVAIAIYGGLANGTATVVTKVDGAVVSTNTVTLDANGVKTQTLNLTSAYVGTLAIEVTYNGIPSPRNVVTKTATVTQTVTNYSPAVSLNGSTASSITVVDSLPVSVTGLPPNYTFTLTARNIANNGTNTTNYTTDSSGKLTTNLSYTYITAAGTWEFTFAFPAATGASFAVSSIVRTVTTTAPAMVTDKTSYGSTETIVWGLYGGMPNGTVSVVSKVSGVTMATNSYTLSPIGQLLNQTFPLSAAYEGTLSFDATFSGVPSPRNVVSKTLTVNGVYYPSVSLPTSITNGGSATLTITGAKANSNVTLTNRINGSVVSSSNITINSSGSYSGTLSSGSYSSAGNWTVELNFGSYGGVITKTCTVNEVTYSPSATLTSSITFGGNIYLTISGGKPYASVSFTNKLNGSATSSGSFSLDASGGYSTTITQSTYGTSGSWSIDLNFGSYGGSMTRYCTVNPVSYSPSVLINGNTLSSQTVVDSMSVSISGLPPNYTFTVNQTPLGAGSAATLSFTTNSSGSWSTTFSYSYTTAGGAWNYTFNFPAAVGASVSPSSISRTVNATSPAFVTAKSSYSSSETLYWSLYGGVPNSSVSVASYLNGSLVSNVSYSLDNNGLRLNNALPLSAAYKGNWTFTATFSGVPSPRNVVSKSITVT